MAFPQNLKLIINADEEQQTHISRMLAHRLGRHASLGLTYCSVPTTRFGLKCNNWRWQSTDTHDGLPVTDTNRKVVLLASLVRWIDFLSAGAEITQKRFWKDVGVERRGESLVVTLDKRALKTPSGQTLQLPLNKTLPAGLVAAEWDHQEVLLKPHALPMVHITCLFSNEIFFNIF